MSLELKPTEQHIVKLLLENGRCPIDDWLRRIRDTTTRARIYQRVYRLEDGRFGDYKTIRDIGELRLDFGPGYRVYFGRVKNVMVVLLIGGDKSTQNADITKAEALWQRFRKQGDPSERLSPWREEGNGNSGESETES